MSYITSIGTANPVNRFEQQQLAEFMVRVMHADLTQSRKIRTVFRASGIDARHSVLEDYGRSNNYTVYPNNGDGRFPGTQERMKLYRQYALPLTIAAIDDLSVSRPDFDLRDVSHLVVVSCTGMYAPGLDIDIIKHFRLSTATERTCINFMGCYAAFNGLKAADAICQANPDAKVLVICTELCSLHFQPDANDDNILANALFGDGAAAMLVEAKSNHKPKLSIEKFHSDLALNGESDMAWSISDFGFEMRLSSYVPDLLKREISAFIDNLLAKLRITRAEIRYFAFHPGGKKILQAIENELKLDPDRNAFSYSVLRRFGNMSSPTVVFVLRDIFDQLTDADNDAWILSAAFGPGLALESMLLKVRTHA